MADFNQAIVMGRLTRDPEVRSTQSGRTLASFTVATGRRWKNPDGQIQEETEFHNITAWGKLGELCGQLLYKGRQVLISGRLQTRSWEGQDGIKRYATDIIANEMSALGPARPGGAGEFQGNTDNANTGTMPAAQQTAPQTTPSAGGEEINLDDIPF